MSSSCSSLRDEFRLRKFLFSGVQNRRFYYFHWRLPPVIFVLYRLALAIYVDFWLIYYASLQSKDSSTSGDKIQPWPCYLTNWTYTALALFLTIHAIIVLVYYVFNASELFKMPSQAQHTSSFHELSSSEGHHNSDYEQIVDQDLQMEIRTFNNRLPWYLILVWILLNIVSTGAVVVTTVFFIFLLPQMKDVSGISMENLQLHTLNSVIVVVENLVTAVPLRLLHVVYPFIYGLVYILFSVFYWIPDHNRVMYPNVLDWNHAGHTTGMIFLLGFVGFPVLHTLYFIIYRIKLFILKKISSV